MGDGLDDGPVPEDQAPDAGERVLPSGAGLPVNLNEATLPGAREFILAVLLLENGVRPVADLDQREVADAVWTLAPHASWPPTYLTAAVIKAMGRVP